MADPADLQAAEAYFGGGAPPAPTGPRPQASPTDLQAAEQYFTAPAQPPAPQPGGNPIFPTLHQAGGRLLDSLGFHQPQSGAANDVVWSSLQSAKARILNSAGYGAANAWGAEPLGLSPDAEAALRKAGVFNDYQTGHQSFMKSVNEVVLRPAAAIADFATRRGFGIPALAAGAGGALEQAEREAQGAPSSAVQEGASSVLGAASELSYGFAEGAFIHMMGEHPASAEHATEAATARATGVLGEGEAGFYGAEPLTPENLEARTEAAKEAGLEAVPPPQPPAPDIHVLARRVDPETFEQYDALAVERDQHRQALAALNAEREASPEAIAARGEIDTILGKVNGVEDRLTKVAAQRLADAQARLDDILRTDTPEQAAIRGKLMDADFAMRDLAPAVSEAYRRAQDMAPNLPEQAAEVAKPSVEGAVEPPKAGTEGAVEPGNAGVEGIAEHVPPVAVEASSQAAGIEPPSVTGEQKLGVGTRVEEGGQKTAGARYGNLRAVEGTGELETRGLAENVEAKAIEDGLTSTFGDLPEYRTLSMKDQAAQVAKLMGEDYEAAKAIAMGDRQPPKGILPESVYVGVEKRALAEGDVDTLQKLATHSKLTTSATTMGQRIRTLGERDQASPVGAIQEVQAAREADLAKRSDIAAAKRETVAEIRSEVRKAASKVDAWADFLKTIECN